MRYSFAALLAVTPSLALAAEPAPPPPASVDAPAVVAPQVVAPPPGVPAPTAAAPKEPAWYERVRVGAFVDAYYAHSWKAPKPSRTPATFRAFDQYKGFNVAWLGIDTALDPDPVGFVGQVRFGSATPNLALADATGEAAGLAVVQQAYAAYRPGGPDGKLTLIFGKFDTVYGHEVPQSHLNINYTRGAMFNLGQPFFHTGFRADYLATKELTLKFLLVNGWNNSIDNNSGKSAGLSIAFVPSERVAVTVGYLGGPEQTDTVQTPADPTTTPPTPASTTAVKGANGRMRHLADVVVDLRPVDPLRVVMNGTYVTEKIVHADDTKHTASWYGGALLARVGLGEKLGVAARGEYFVDAKHGLPTGGLFVGADGNPKKGTIMTGTLTLEALPTKNLLVRLENRLDHASEKVFADGLTGTTKQQVTTTLGVVVKTD
ncbi:MAG: porin [Polyangiaceae bacterium]|nr:porin [Polyangiaceae bacterium]